MRKVKFVIPTLLAIVAVFAVVSTLFFTDDAAANNGVEYAYFVGDPAVFAPNCLLPGNPACPAVAEASNGDTIEIVGGGVLSKPREASGAGTFVHRTSGGDLVGSGTWVATELVSFRPFGPNVNAGFPQEFQAGEAEIRIDMTAPDGTVFQGTLTIGCLLGPPRSYPRGAFEGVRVDVEGILNFDMDRLGATIFIRQH